MGNFEKFGTNAVKGPFYPQSGLGKWTSTPISKLPKAGTVGAVYTAGKLGWEAGRQLDKHFDLSGKIADFGASHTPSSAKWWMHKHL